MDGRGGAAPGQLRSGRRMLAYRSLFLPCCRRLARGRSASGGGQRQGEPRSASEGRPASEGGQRQREVSVRGGQCQREVSVRGGQRQGRSTRGTDTGLHPTWLHIIHSKSLRLNFISESSSHSRTDLPAWLHGWPSTPVACSAASLYGSHDKFHENAMLCD